MFSAASYRPKVISLFAGCGGSSLGYEMAGCEMLAAIERDPHAASVYQANHPSTRILQEDITVVSPEGMLAKLGLKPGELDILDGSPPCQGFSMAGKRQGADPRNRLFTEYVRFLNALRPKAFVMENVPGLTTGRMRGIFYTVIAALEAAGYTVRARILNAAHYGVPQSRQRVIILGIRADLGLVPEHPMPLSVPVSFRDAVRGLGAHGLIVAPKGKAMALAQALKPGESADMIHERYGHKRNDFSLIRLHWDRPSPTVCKTIRPGQAGLLHPAENRYLSIGELKRVCSFPDAFELFGSFEEQWGRLGNAVPPMLMKAVAESLSHQLGGV
jgi:DNA (cytosine-5)-methyltransferase 1